MESDVETGSALFTEEVLAVGDARVAEARHIPTGSGVSRRREREPGESGREENERVITYGSLSRERRGCRIQCLEYQACIRGCRHGWVL